MTKKIWDCIVHENPAMDFIVCDGQEIEPLEVVKILNKYEDELNEQDQKIKETKDMFYEAHKQQQDCLKEVIKLKEEKRELGFKLGTLIKAYSRNNCAFNGQETEYLKSLRE